MFLCTVINDITMKNNIILGDVDVTYGNANLNYTGGKKGVVADFCITTYFTLVELSHEILQVISIFLCPSLMFVVCPLRIRNRVLVFR